MPSSSNNLTLSLQPTVLRWETEVDSLKKGKSHHVDNMLNLLIITTLEDFTGDNSPSNLVSKRKSKVKIFYMSRGYCSFRDDISVFKK